MLLFTFWSVEYLLFLDAKLVGPFFFKWSGLAGPVSSREPFIYLF